MAQTLKLDNFSGIMPRRSARLLPPNGAVAAGNAKLLSGELRGYHETQLLHDFNPTNVARAFRLPQTVSAPIPIQVSDQWIGFSDPGVDFVRTPVLEDSFERYYWTGDSTHFTGAPAYNTRARINAAQAPFQLGIPTPVHAPAVVAPAGTSETRAYVYTFISAYGEEGPPSPPTVAVGSLGAWNLSGIDASVPNPGNYNLTTVRIYRTVAGSQAGSQAQFFWVADISLGTTVFSDTASDTFVANNFTMPSLTWTGPPATLQGIVAHPGGFLVGFSGRDLWISEPYHPHAWPLQYVQTCQTEIVGIAIFANCIIVMTTSHPYFAEGMSPLNITLQKLDSIDPCVSRRSIATTLYGVYYSSPQGIVKHTGGATELVTRQLFTREEWQNFFSPTTIYAVPYGVEYIAFDTSAAGFIFSPTDPTTPLTTLDRFSGVTAIQQDQYTGDAYIISNNQVRLWDPPKSTPYTYTWRSREFDFPRPVNFGAFRLKFAPSTITISPQQLTDYTTFNNGRIAKPLNCLNLAPLNGVRTMVVANSVLPQIRNPIGGSPLYPLGQYTNVTGAVVVNIYARDLTSEWSLVFTWTVNSEKIYRMPAGFKSDVWQVELIGNVPVYSFAMGETAMDLKGL